MVQYASRESVTHVLFFATRALDFQLFVMADALSGPNSAQCSCTPSGRKLPKPGKNYSDFEASDVSRLQQA